MASSSTSGKGARVVALIFVVFFGLLAWYIAPWFLPVYQWTSVDFQKIADRHDLSAEQAEQLAQPQTFTFRYATRGKDDPFPWQVLLPDSYQSPTWVVDGDGQHFQEFAMVVRADLVSNRTGDPPSTFFKGGTSYDNYFEAKAWRLPSGSLERDHPRPIFLIDAASWEPLGINRGKVADGKLKLDLRKENWISDDWPGVAPWRDDGYEPPREEE